MSIAGYLNYGNASHVQRMYHGQTVIQYPLGDKDNPQTVVGCLVDWSNEPGTNELPGDGVVTPGNTGNRERRSGRIEVPANITVSESDLWLIDGEKCTTQRRAAADASDKAFQAWIVTSIIHDRTARPMVRGENIYRRGSSR